MGHNVGNGIHFPGRPGVTPDQRTMDHADEGGIVSGRFRVARQSCRLDYRVANANPRRVSLDLGVVFGIYFAVASLLDRHSDTESLHRGHSLMKEPTVDEAATDLLRRFAGGSMQAARWIENRPRSLQGLRCCRRALSSVKVVTSAARGGQASEFQRSQKHQTSLVANAASLACQSLILQAKTSCGVCWSRVHGMLDTGFSFFLSVDYRKGRWNMEGEVYRVADASHSPELRVKSQESRVQQARNMVFRDERQQCRTATPAFASHFMGITVLLVSLNIVRSLSGRPFQIDFSWTTNKYGYCGWKKITARVPSFQFPVPTLPEPTG
ncbi:uncharacterized protein CLUP02_16031 [Colletotrichum lupini]|uniref:Uncharacterized protein n=1 Tax=Colletotrichum lupini TaxID=145971 RepID=A0A9Q8WP99_9PEZI|nr:uncharacterized protein CLUP02_16031 [Colletotrichum lupini]UQC90501.1 hypothetical protein CLUP02_16031 [Colletotrichum lupini]